MAKISEIVERLLEVKEKSGDIEVMMQATTLKNNDETIFDSTVETSLVSHHNGEEVVQLLWQM